MPKMVDPRKTSYIELVGLADKEVRVAKAYPHRSKGTNAVVVSLDGSDVVAWAYCTGTVIEGQHCKAGETMRNGDAVFIQPAEPNPNSIVDLVLDHELRISGLETLETTVKGLIHDFQVFQGHQSPSVQ